MLVCAKCMLTKIKKKIEFALKNTSVRDVFEISWQTITILKQLTPF